MPKALHNKYMVGARGDKIIIINLTDIVSSGLDKEDVLNLCAWLMIVSEQEPNDDLVNLMNETMIMESQNI